MSNASSFPLTSQTQGTTSRLRLLALSNGHGEDAIAVRILHQLQQLQNPPVLSALPLVGEGYAYQKLDIPLIGLVRTMPSGGFIYMDKRQLMRDIRGGLVQLTFHQIQAIRDWVNSQKKLGHQSAILAVGDIVPLSLAWISGANYAFVGTAKSEYHVRDEIGLLKRNKKTAWLENFSGSIYHPWERWFMSRRRCRAVFPRDSLTTQILKKWSIPAFDLGNPMMDSLEPSFPTARFYGAEIEKQELARPLIVTLLPGSRPPEAYANWQKILIAVSALIELSQERNFQVRASKNLVFLGAIAPSLHFESMRQILQSYGFCPCSESPVQILDSNAAIFKQKNTHLILTQSAYNDCLHLADIAIAMAGTATEQFVGLGKPAITIPGNGPQFTFAFAEAQSRLLGASVILVEQPQEVAQVVRSLFANPDQLHCIAENGLRRMGKPGAAQRIADCLIKRLA
ncbi:lipid-A-disaccharide synthase-related protein [Chlorogloeopsis sp. ULAP01]|uniref:lipid-A-disaccharide synthase-related protein n=1 Tax=Chlorogloeopsis sp. ULAP01 TaxID=3056483 RepID=UPI0025AA462E|nr:lipid-A-disaccharide synthase-related protein [Chlorogloeopsis sp. ULAP01]MDM9384144.1 lipid-A-disaccharide synthase-related protein [Chlorogloeopsis sp. ULAP01]